MTTPKERGILFSGAMVRALLAGKKTQTRRAVKPTPTRDPIRDLWTWSTRGHIAQWTGTGLDAAAVAFAFRDRCPYGQPGDRLWVRETTLDDGTEHGNIHYRANATDADNAWLAEAGLKWTPSLLMPRSRCRITLAVESIRVERAQDISDADIEAEGVDAEAVEALWAAATKKRRHEAGYSRDRYFSHIDGWPRAQWAAAWTLINGRASWDANPWVWVVSFKVTP